MANQQIITQRRLLAQPNHGNFQIANPNEQSSYIADNNTLSRIFDGSDRMGGVGHTVYPFEKPRNWMEQMDEEIYKSHRILQISKRPYEEDESYLVGLNGIKEHCLKIHAQYSKEMQDNFAMSKRKADEEADIYVAGIRQMRIKALKRHFPISGVTQSMRNKNDPTELANDAGAAPPPPAGGGEGDAG